jgi:hypothetical protein
VSLVQLSIHLSAGHGVERTERLIHDVANETEKMGKLIKAAGISLT